ncbi:ABC transporter ATP-binding protein [Sphingobium amiense]|uniref:ABC transporter ATP-binding protein n=1 Tax=Sphingobium amiense TaxID=135719 RepID=A0A494W213_9SPHN|nr:ABC transporter ATP-binding protein [Sphingobium amiense]BBD97208.1 ABC transporter ATP-binding protein [Sphingobium amiense]
MSTIVLEGVSKRFGDYLATGDIDLVIPSGQFTVFVGPSGCGKTTLLRLIAGLEDMDEGRLLIDGTDMARTPPSGRGLAMVFQSYALYPHMTVRGNLGFALKIARQPAGEIASQVESVARMLNLDALLDRKPAELSGGQRQRVAIGRALVRQPKAFLFDEPLSNLDAALRGQMRFEIRRLQQELGITAIYVTHDQAEAMTMADQIVVFRNGRIEQKGTPLEIYRRPANKFVAGFIGSPQMNFLNGMYADHYHATTIGIRPEHLKLDPDGSLKGAVRTVEHLGNEALLHVQLQDGSMLTARCSEDVAVPADGDIAFATDRSSVYRFDPDGRTLPEAA